MNTLSLQKQTEIVAALTEGCGIRTTERLTGTNRNTIMSLSLRVGAGCARLHDRLMRDLQVGALELDEQWDFIAKKQKRVRQDVDGDQPHQRTSRQRYLLRCSGIYVHRRLLGGRGTLHRQFCGARWRIDLRYH